MLPSKALLNVFTLSASKSEFTQISAVHVYSLSPAPIHDAGLVCTLTPDLRVIDAKQVAENKEWATLVGKLVGSHIAVCSPCVFIVDM